MGGGNIVTSEDKNRYINGNCCLKYERIQKHNDKS